MSRIGKQPISMPKGVSFQIVDNEIVVTGPRGELRREIHQKVDIKKDGDAIVVNVKNSSEKGAMAFWGTWRSLVANMVEGVSEGFEKKLEINGVGYKAEPKGDILVLHVGYSHAIEYKVPDDVSVSVDKKIITVAGIDKQRVGEIAAQIRKTKKPEPYKGKGIKYVDEVIRRKAGKALKGASEG